MSDDMILTGATILVVGLWALAVGLYYRQRAKVRLTSMEVLQPDDTEGYAVLITNPHTGREWRIYACGMVEGFEGESALVVVNKIPALLDAAAALGYSEAESLADIPEASEAWFRGEQWEGADLDRLRELRKGLGSERQQEG